MAVALVFPGQGSQSVGMLGAFATRYPLITQCFQQASEAVGLDLWQIANAGPAELPNMTELT